MYNDSFLPVQGWRQQDLGLLSLWSRPDRDEISCELLNAGQDDMGILMMSQCLHFVHDKALDFGGVPFHAALVELEGKGVLLAGPGGRGKTTCCRRLPAKWKILCDDEALVLKDEFGRYVAHPFPTWKECLPGWSERTWRVQSRVPLSAIFFLERGESDTVIPIGTGEAANRINGSATQICFLSLEYLNKDEQRAWRKRVFDNACCLAESIPAFVLRVSPTGAFWQEMERVLRTLSAP
jgi:SynChlorMet cassette protein ScmC